MNNASRHVQDEMRQISRSSIPRKKLELFMPVQAHIESLQES